MNANEQCKLLFPVPRELKLTGGVFSLPPVSLIYLEHDAPALYPIALRLKTALAGVGRRVEITAAPGPATVTLSLAADGIPQGYRLTAAPAGVVIAGGDVAGVFYGVATFCQLLELYPEALPCLSIEDWPDFVQRGVMLDVSRDKVPTLETLYALVDLLAGWKINELQLYMEHTFAYRGHEVVWEQASPFTGEDLLALDVYCRARYIEFVPNQNSFGHMHRWLKHEAYRQVAECPDGVEHPFSHTREPYGLCAADPAALALLRDLYAQLLPHFSSRQFNVGLDETYDLGLGRSAEACAARGKGRVYLDFLKDIQRLLAGRGFTMQFWGDIILHYPELIPELPPDAIALEWGYEADHPFAEHTALFAAAGLRFYVCPGTSSWNTIAGRTENALGNLQNAAVNGKAAGAVGYLNTDWGDYGHLQPLPVSYLGFLAGAGVSWNAATDLQTLDLPALLDRWAFGDAAGVMGRLAYDLGNVYQRPGPRLDNSSLLFWLLLRPEMELSPYIAQGLSTASLQATLHAIDAAIAPLDAAQMARSDAPQIREEFRWAAAALSFAAHLGAARLEAEGVLPHALPEAMRTGLVAELRGLIARRRGLWLARHRPGGLSDALARLERALAQFAAP